MKKEKKIENWILEDEKNATTIYLIMFDQKNILRMFSIRNLLGIEIVHTNNFSRFMKSVFQQYRYRTSHSYLRWKKKKGGEFRNS